MAERVNTYYARWSPTKHTGYVVLYWSGGSKTLPEQSFQSPTEFQIIVDLLRNEKPVWWDEPTSRLFCHNEPVGEGE